ncbi:MAG: prolyl oligopeptidase family serine peptidase [Candidatus Sulfopaludibacter sp.]|nr:prolyl oligopeptidase family serine peptidase [Candidatus Sulfopaludibacter sp.]
MIIRAARPLLLVWGLALYGQDASLALRTSVTYNTQKSTLPLSESQRRQADELGRQAQQASQAGKYGEALRDYYHGLAVMRGASWTPLLELASALQAHAAHSLVEPGNQVVVTLSPLYGTPPAEGVRLSAAAFLVPAGKEAGPLSLGSAVAVDPAALPLRIAAKVPETAAGDYKVEVRLTPGPASAAFVKSMPLHVEALAKDVQQLHARVAKLVKQNGPALQSAEYALTLYDRADAGEIDPTRLHWRSEFAAANAILDDLDAGRDPFAHRRGDMRKAYRSSVDQQLQPYRLFIPESYDGSKPVPLVVALHGMGGDENSMFDSYGGTLKREAARVGFAVVCPKGRDTASMYRGAAEQDVMAVLAEVRRDYQIDGQRIYLMGHSMGGFGTWSVAMDHPDVFAALGPISGGGNPANMAKISRIPEYVVHGDDDRTVPVTQSRTMVEAARKSGAHIVYVEVPGGSHTSVAAPQMGPMLDFFKSQAKP